MENSENKDQKLTEVAKNFLSMNSLLKCVSLYLDYFAYEKLTEKFIKQISQRLGYAIKHFQDSYGSLLKDPEYKKTWSDNWEKRDFESIARTLNYWVDMDDEQRATLEFAAQQIVLKNFKIELEDDAK